MPKLTWMPSAQAILHLMQAVAIVVGGCWIFYRYLAHERIALERANAQQLALAKTTVATEEARLRHLILANQQSTLTLSRQREFQELTLRQQTLATEQARLTLETSEAQRKLRMREIEQTVELQRGEIELKRLERVQKERDLTVAGQTRFSWRSSLDVISKRPADQKLSEYHVVYGFSVKNESDLPLELSLIIIDYFIGLPNERVMALPMSIAQISTPDVRGGNTGGEYDAIHWRHMGSIGSIRRETVTTLPWWSKPPYPMPSFMSDGEGTGPMQPNHELGLTRSYVVRAPENAYVAFAVTYCFDGCRDRSHDYMKRDYTLLALSRSSATAQ